AGSASSRGSASIASRDRRILLGAFMDAPVSLVCVQARARSDSDGTDREVRRMCIFKGGARLLQRLDLRAAGTGPVGRLQLTIERPQLRVRVGGGEVAWLRLV